MFLWYIEKYFAEYVKNILVVFFEFGGEIS